MKQGHLTQAELLDWLTGEPELTTREALQAHLNSCQGCKNRLAETSTIWDALKWEVEIPVELRKRTLRKIPRTRPRKSAVGTVKQWIPYLLAAVVLTLASFFFLSRDVDFSRISHGIIVTSAAVWVSLFILFLLMTAQREDRGLSIPARIGLGASMLFLIAIFLCPKTRFVFLWKQFMGTMVAEYFLAAWLIYFSVGIAYSLLPTFLMALLFGRSDHRGSFRSVLSSAATFILLLLPALYLQCAPLGLGIALGWFGGSIIGALGGNFMGYGLRYYLVGARGAAA